ncbi:hypothetical protein JCM6882_008528 [Rhodosporidiobolus microsporus]
MMFFACAGSQTDRPSPSSLQQSGSAGPSLLSRLFLDCFSSLDRVEEAELAAERKNASPPPSPTCAYAYKPLVLPSLLLSSASSSEFFPSPSAHSTAVSPYTSPFSSPPRRAAQQTRTGHLSDDGGCDVPIPFPTLSFATFSFPSPVTPHKPDSPPLQLACALPIDTHTDPFAPSPLLASRPPFTFTAPPFLPLPRRNSAPAVVAPSSRAFDSSDTLRRWVLTRRFSLPTPLALPAIVLTAPVEDRQTEMVLLDPAVAFSELAFDEAPVALEGPAFLEEDDGAETSSCWSSSSSSSASSSSATSTNDGDDLDPSPSLLSSLFCPPSDTNDAGSVDFPCGGPGDLEVDPASEAFWAAMFPVPPVRGVKGGGEGDVNADGRAEEEEEEAEWCISA